MRQMTEEERAAIVARIRENYDYDNAAGKLISRRTGKVVRGFRASYTNGVSRYLKIVLFIDGRRYDMCYHRAVWAWHYGRLPTMQIDHLNHDRYDNRIENLRETTPSENLLNQAHPWRPGSGGLPGVENGIRTYRIWVKQKCFCSRDPYHLFYHLTLLGRRFK